MMASMTLMTTAQTTAIHNKLMLMMMVSEMFATILPDVEGADSLFVKRPVLRLISQLQKMEGWLQQKVSALTMGLPIMHH